MNASDHSTANKLALITGASEGIGYELAKQFAQNGYDLIIAAEDPGIVEARQAFESLGAVVTSVQVNLAHAKGVEFLYSKVKEYGRPLSAVAINAGVGVGGDFARQTDLAAELNMINLNVTSAVHLSKLVLKDMLAQGEGKILFTSSIAATMPAPFQAVYGGTKAFLHSFAEALRNELKDTQITITSLMPGATDTNFFERAGMQDTKLYTEEKDDPAQVAKEGFLALMAGKDHVVAGSLKNKVLAYGGKILSDQVKAELHRRESAPGTAES